MFNLIKMDFYRLFCMKSFWVMILVTIGMAFFSAGMTNVDLGFMEKEMDATELVKVESEEMEASFGIYTETDSAWVDGDIPFSDLILGSFRSCLLLILCAIFVPLFVNGEQKSGYIKNIAGQLPGKGMLVIPKLAVAAVQVFLILGVFSLFTGAAGLMFWGGRFVFGSLSEFALGFGLQLLLHFAFAAILLMLTMVFKNSGVSIGFGILCAMGFLILLLGFVNQLFVSIDGLEHINILHYIIETNVQSVVRQMEQSAVHRSLAVSLIYIGISAVLSVIVVQKRDV